MQTLSRAVFWKQAMALALFAGVFVAASGFAQYYRGELAAFVGQGGAAGVVAYIALTAVFVVFVIPLDIALLIPLGSAVWGAVPTALMSITGWTAGAAVAFGIARRWGAPLVERLIGLSRVRALEARIPKRNTFWMVVFLRMLISVDILSYALGLFSAMPWGAYVAATALGVAPFGFYFAYAGTLPLAYRLAAVALAFSLAAFVLFVYRLPREP